jgi:hypothetical protein
MTLKKVKRGEFVSYGTIYLAQEDKKDCRYSRSDILMVTTGH